MLKKHPNPYIIDAREIPDSRRKNLIFETFDGLPDSEEMILFHAHQAQPLQKLFERERTGQYEWKSTQQDPGTWKISIRKKPGHEYTVGDLININPGAIYILAEYGFAFYTNLTTPVKNLFLNRREDFSAVIQKCIHARLNIFKIIHPDIWSLEFLIEYILENHHRYLHDLLPALQSLIIQIEKNFGSGHTHLKLLRSSFDQFMEELNEHLQDEENVIFPSLLALTRKPNPEPGEEQQIIDQLNWMVEDHYIAGDNFSSMRKICNHYNTENIEIAGIKLIYTELANLEKDFLLHMYFENHLLPKALRLRFPGV